MVAYNPSTERRCRATPDPRHSTRTCRRWGAGTQHTSPPFSSTPSVPSYARHTPFLSNAVIVRFDYIALQRRRSLFDHTVYKWGSSTNCSLSVLLAILIRLLPHAVTSPLVGSLGSEGRVSVLGARCNYSRCVLCMVSQILFYVGDNRWWRVLHSGRKIPSTLSKTIPIAFTGTAYGYLDGKQYRGKFACCCNRSRIDGCERTLRHLLFAFLSVSQSPASRGRDEGDVSHRHGHALARAPIRRESGVRRRRFAIG